MLTLKLPIPPSTNNLYRNVPGKGRVKSRAYKGWLNEVGWLNGHVIATIPFERAELRVRVPNNRRRDLDNQLKPICDYLQSRGIITNDNCIDKITIERDPELKDHVMVTVLEPMPA